mmetsp:Transcript_68446/g.153714  ORF Transcript_68446/g.153714 Transcript_68446/m.153714 type:complete len:181 (+) Transcript_68446:53-595(+)
MSATTRLWGMGWRRPLPFAATVAAIGAAAAGEVLPLDSGLVHQHRLANASMDGHARGLAASTQCQSCCLERTCGLAYNGMIPGQCCSAEPITCCPSQGYACYRDTCQPTGEAPIAMPGYTPGLNIMGPVTLIVIAVLAICGMGFVAGFFFLKEVKEFFTGRNDSPAMGAAMAVAGSGALG